ncbi:hypothetical protein ACFCXK_04680 [Streptomyces sp. NPDC056269]|uniref:hypothetical protein n=1 Tax=Streptomyces sp. NPDC056269 TaxID=3345768 RepID=UPI0035D8B7D0
MNTEACDTTRHVDLRGYSGRARKWQTASWNRVLREATVGSLIMLIPALLLGFFISWQIGIAIIVVTAGAAALSSLFFSFRGHTLGCAAKKGIVLALGWWERV